jgi:hypothetical protein
MSETPEKLDIPWYDDWRKQVMAGTKAFIVDYLLVPKINESERNRKQRDIAVRALEELETMGNDYTEPLAVIARNALAEIKEVK